MTKQTGNAGIANGLAEPVALGKITPVQRDPDLTEVRGPSMAGEPAAAEEQVLAFVRGLPSHLSLEIGAGLGLMQLRVEGIQKEAMQEIDRALRERFGDTADVGWHWSEVGSLTQVLPTGHPLRGISEEKIAAGMANAGLNLEDYEHLRHFAQAGDAIAPW